MSNDLLKTFTYPLKVVITRIDDPKLLNRVQVYIPSYHGAYDDGSVGYGDDLGTYPWAQLCTTLFKDSGNYVPSSLKDIFSGDMPIVIPAVGTVGWCIFEGGDIRAPIYMGSLAKGDVNETVAGEYQGSDANNLSTTGGSQLDIMADIIFANESGGKNYNIVTACDVDALSIGLLQWHGNNARGLMQKIHDVNPTKFDTIVSNAHASINLSADWSKWVLEKNSVTYNTIKTIIDSTEGHQCQDDLVREYLSTYIEKGVSVGVTDFSAQIYFCDMYNQSPKGAMEVAKTSQGKDLDSLYQRTLSSGCWLGSSAYHNKDRRTTVYNAIKLLQSNGGLVPTTSTNLQGAPSLDMNFAFPSDYKTVAKPFEKGSSNPRVCFYEEGIIGSPVKASHAGKATFRDRGRQGYGKYVSIVNGKYETRYTNLMSLEGELNSQQDVNVGDIIGYVGQSGDASEACLNVILLVNGVPVDPIPYFSGVSNSANATSGGVIDNAINFMVNIANDANYGYSQQHRWGNPDYDCSSLVISGYQSAGIDVKGAGATYTGNMRSAFSQCGFQVIPYTRGMNLVRGDVLLNDVYHTACYIGDNQIVHASTAGGHPEGGDQTGKEICVRDMYEYSKGWNCILRYNG